jgi:hypothetical protein
VAFDPAQRAVHIGPCGLGVVLRIHD